MNETSGTESKRRSRLRWVTLGEAIAIAALIISGLGLWHELNKPDQKPVVFEQRQSIPLKLRSRVEDDGRELVISPVEPSHALVSLNVSLEGYYPIELGSEGRLKADYVEAKLSGTNKDKGAHSITVGVTVRYVELGKDRETKGQYVLRYQIEGGGLLGSRSLRLVSLSR